MEKKKFEEYEEMLLNTSLSDNEAFNEFTFLSDKHFVWNAKVFREIKHIYDAKGTIAPIDLILNDIDFDFNVSKVQPIQSLQEIAKLLFDEYNSNLIKRAIKRLDYNSGLDTTLTQLTAIMDMIEDNYNRVATTNPVDVEKFIGQMRERRLPNSEVGLMVKSLPTFNSIIGGMLGGDLIGIYGKEKSTKTTLAHEIILDIGLDQKIPVGIFNFEMDEMQLSMKTMSMRTGIDPNVLRNPHGNKISDNEFERKATQFVKDFNGATLVISDDILDEQQIFARTKEMIKLYGVRIVVIDYLLLIDPSMPIDGFRHTINYLTKFFKRMARKLDIPVILISQANDDGKREAEGKGLSRDSNYFFYVEKLERGQKVVIAGTEHTASDGDFIVINRGIRHVEGSRAFLTRFIDNSYREITVGLDNYVPNNWMDNEK